MKLYVLGHPVAHSKSPVMHNALYRALGLDWEYGLMDCDTEEAANDFLNAADFLGINITTPYKPAAFAHADVADSSAVLAQGANVLVHEGGRLAAYNLDGRGCVRYLEMRGVDFKGARVVVCGTGPTSLAIMHAVVEAGAPRVALLGRDAKRATSVLRDWKRRADSVGVPRDCTLLAGSYAGSIDELTAASVVIDATPLGMKPEDPAPFNTARLCPHATVFDVVYGHGDTALAIGAREHGCTFYNGEGMLVAQAVLGAEKFLQAAGDLPFGGLDFSKAYHVMHQAADFAL